MLEADVQTVLSHYALSDDTVRHVQALENAGGWSGSRLWSFTECRGAEMKGVGSLCRNASQPSGKTSPDKDSRPLCLRRWPQEHPTRERLTLIHELLRLVSNDLPIVAYPLRTIENTTIVEFGGHLWELTNWLPGEADYHARPTRERLRSAMRLLAKFHRLAGRYDQRRAIAPAIADRQRHLGHMRETGLASIERAIAKPLNQEVDDRSLRLLAASCQALKNRGIDQSLAAAPELLLQPAIRDIHSDHVLFTGEEVTGLIDFGAMRIDTPLADVARLAGSLVGDDQEARQFAFDAYSELRPLMQDERRLIDTLDETGVVLGALNWLTWLYVERRDMGPVDPIVRRLDQLLTRLEWRASGTRFGPG